MQARFSINPPELELQGKSQEYILLSSLLKKHSGIIYLTHYSDEPKPYQRFADKLVILSVANQKVSISVGKEEGVIAIVGDEKWLEALSCNIESFGREALKGEHSHEEYFEGHSYLDPSTMPCVFSMN